VHRPSTEELTVEANHVKVGLVWRVTGWLLLIAVLVVGFIGYTMPGMRLNWETIAAMCGF